MAADTRTGGHPPAAEYLSPPSACPSPMPHRTRRSPCTCGVDDIDPDAPSTGRAPSPARGLELPAPPLRPAASPSPALAPRRAGGRDARAELGAPYVWAASSPSDSTLGPRHLRVQAGYGVRCRAARPLGGAERRSVPLVIRPGDLRLLPCVSATWGCTSAGGRIVHAPQSGERSRSRARVARGHDGGRVGSSARISRS